MSDQRQSSYSQQQASAILKRALQRREVVEGLSHDDLVETAREVGIEPADLERAIAEEKRERAQAELREQWIERRRARIRSQAVSWLVVGLICFAINFFLGPPWWFFWVSGPWAGLIVLQWAKLRQGPSWEELERMQLKRRREQRREELRAKFEVGAQVFGDVVEQGVGALLSAMQERKQQRLEPGRGERPPGRNPGDRGGHTL